MEDSKHKGHVVVLPYPSQGHLNPLLQFAKRLASKGVKATFATTHYTVNCIHAPNVSVEPISDGFDEHGYAQANDEGVFIKEFKANGTTTLSQLIRKFQYSSCPVNCVVYDSFLPWALDVAKQHGIQGASFFTNSSAESAITSCIYRGRFALPVKLEDTPLFLPSLPPLNYRDLPAFLKLPEKHPAYLAMKLSQFSNLDMADWIFGNTFEALEGKEENSLLTELWPGKMIGPMVPSFYLDGHIEGDKGYGSNLWKPVGEECLNWLETKPPQSVAYISFGSMVSMTEQQMEELACAFKETDFYFLWVVRESEIGKIPSSFVDSVNGKGLIITWSNQLEILAHQATGCFVTHCGWNSTLEALSLGVPMVAMPLWADQFTNAKYIGEIWRIGVRVNEDEKGIVRREEMIRCLRLVMEGQKSQEIRKNGRKLSQLAKEAIAEGGSSDKHINNFVEGLRASNRK
uniref:Glycosyltransferase n=1 Tax=Rhizophora mucronata TaxID=61149 RepID=A0A2P2NFH1_RHIMU